MTRKILLVYIYAVSSRARSKVHLTVGPSTSCGELKPFLSFLAPGASRNLEQPDIPGNEMGISLCLAGVPRGEAIANVVNSRTIHSFRSLSLLVVVNSPSLTLLNGHPGSSYLSRYLKYRPPSDAERR